MKFAPAPKLTEDVLNGVEKLQEYYEKAVESRYFPDNYETPNTMMVNLHTQIALLGEEAYYLRVPNPGEVKPDHPFALQLAEVLLELVRMSNSHHIKFDLSEAIKLTEAKHRFDNIIRVDSIMQNQKAREEELKKESETLQEDEGKE